LAGVFKVSWNSEDVINSFFVILRASGFARSALVSRGNAILFVFRAQFVVAHTVMRAVEILTGTLAATTLSTSRGCGVEESHQRIGVVIGASMLANSAFFGSGNSFAIVSRIVGMGFAFFVLCAKRIPAHAILVTELILARTLAPTRKIEALSEDVVESFLIIARARCLTSAALVRSLDTVIIIGTTERVTTHAVVRSI
jgi:hypothetical protein